MMGPSLFGEDTTPQDPGTGFSTPESATGTELTRYSPTVSLYRKHRPQSFGDDLVGQDHVVLALRNAVLLDRVGHAYLFSGPRGTGKTTTARILAKAVNCLDPEASHRPCNACDNCVAINTGATPDVIEIDAASNRGIDDIRDLRERVRYAPAQLRSKVYIIDEAHQITGAAANAFLKTLEEPPSHTRFILATTDPEELLPTIVSRCQRFEFRRVSVDDMLRRLSAVAAQEGIAVDEDALRIIARHATGSLRDALGLLERLALLAAEQTSESRSSRIKTEDVLTTLGLSRNERIENLVAAIAERSAADALRSVAEAIDAGEDPRQLNKQLVSYLRLLLVERSGASAESDDRARQLAAKFTLSELASHARRFGEIDFAIKHAPYPQLPLEIALVEATIGDRSERHVEQPKSDTALQPDGSPRPASLRDRIRASTAIREVPSPAAPRPNHPQPVPIDVARSSRAEAISTSSEQARSVDVGQIADLWPSVRADVKALNRRIEALLSEVDPVAITGSQITLAVPYPFHRDKLNTEEVRDTVAGVLSRLLGQDVSVVCILRGEIPNHVEPLATPREATPTSHPGGNESIEEAEQRDLERLQAAKNIFDAEEIDSATVVARTLPGGDA